MPSHSSGCQKVAVLKKSAPEVVREVIIREVAPAPAARIRQ